MRETSFGRMKRIEVGGEPVEIMEFTEPGSLHTHQRWEHGFVLSGCGEVEAGKSLSPIEAGALISVPPGVEHRMIPHDHEGAKPYRWLIFYSDGPIPERDPTTLYGSYSAREEAERDPAPDEGGDDRYRIAVEELRRVAQGAPEAHLGPYDARALLDRLRTREEGEGNE